MEGVVWRVSPPWEWAPQVTCSEWVWVVAVATVANWLDLSLPDGLGAGWSVALRAPQGAGMGAEAWGLWAVVAWTPRPPTNSEDNGIHYSV